MEDKIRDLALYRLEQAKDNLEEASILFEIGKLKGANNRAYYAIFHSIKAILALEEVDFKKHSSVLAYFNKNYINKGKFSTELGKRISKASYIREKSDYVDFYIVSKEDTREQIETAKTVIDSISKYIMDKEI